MNTELETLKKRLEQLAQSATQTNPNWPQLNFQLGLQICWQLGRLVDSQEKPATAVQQQLPLAPPQPGEDLLSRIAARLTTATYNAITAYKTQYPSTLEQILALDGRRLVNFGMSAFTEVVITLVGTGVSFQVIERSPLWVNAKNPWREMALQKLGNNGAKM